MTRTRIVIASRSVVPVSATEVLATTSGVKFPSTTEKSADYVRGERLAIVEAAIVLPFVRVVEEVVTEP